MKIRQLIIKSINKAGVERTKLTNRILVAISKLQLQYSSKEKFECSICGYIGPFMDINVPTGFRRHSECPECSSLERHRIQYLVVRNILNGMNTSKMKMLHFAPEQFFMKFFSKRFDRYETADLSMQDVDYNVDLQDLPFDDSTYDFVFASHVLEHIPDDMKAVEEMCRILKPNGIAILQVPIVSKKTIEYPEPNPKESSHVRAPGMDYFDRYERYFARIELFSSDLLPAKYQLFSYEDRSKWPTKECPLRPAAEGERHIQLVAVCYV